MTWHYNDLGAAWHRIHGPHEAELQLCRGRWVLRWGLLRWRAPQEMTPEEARAWADRALEVVG